MPSPNTTLPNCSGVYKIRCIPTGKIYIGSSVNIENRYQHHRQSLIAGNHRNPYLQMAWNKYGEEAFEFSVLEIVEPTNLLNAEQYWIDKTSCCDRKFGFNVYPVDGSPGDVHARSWEGFVDPEGNEIIIQNLYQFCRQRGLNATSMYRLAKGKSKLKSYKGWTHKNSVRQREFVKTYEGFIAPDGTPVEPITNLAAFCRVHNLDNTHMVAVLRGRICSHRGWTHRNGRKRSENTYTGFINPDNQQVIITNLQAFCRANGLHPVHMHELKNGKRKQYKGWTWRENNE